MYRKNWRMLVFILLSAANLAGSYEAEAKIILVLGSGGSRGLAHVGVIEELENLGIVPDGIVGCSSGALVGALYAQHGDIAKVKEILYELKYDDIVDFSFFQKGALSTREKFQAFLKDNLTANDFSQLKIPFVAVVTDLNKGKPVYLEEGELHPAVLASAALPGLFAPYTIEDRVYIDGGVCDPLPVQFAREWKKGIIIASDISSSLDGFDADNLPQILRKSFEIGYQRLAYFSRQYADILLEMNFEEIDSPLDDSHNPEIYERGKQVVRELKKEIKMKAFP